MKNLNILKGVVVGGFLLTIFGFGQLQIALMRGQPITFPLLGLFAGTAITVVADIFRRYETERRRNPMKSEIDAIILKDELSKTKKP